MTKMNTMATMNSKRTVHILGAAGQLGHALRATIPLQEGAPAYTVRTYTREDCPLEDPQVFHPHHTALQLQSAEDIVLNCAAYTAVDRAETEPHKAERCNAQAPAELAQLCAHTGAHLVHVSTDYVCGGPAPLGPTGEPRAWTTTDPVDPLSVYGQTKAQGEEAVLATHPQGSTIVRTAWLYYGPQRQAKGIAGSDFVTTMLRLYRERGELTVVNDAQGCPTSVHDLARGLWSLVEHTSTASQPLPQILHATNAGHTSWWGFAYAIIEEIGGDPQRVHPCSHVEYPTPAQRPLWSVLSADEWISAGLPAFRPWREALHEVLLTQSSQID